ncbi:MAG TPA: TetR/AcrR family transcriptional regulator [Thermomicrobiales bacterium]|nr:TetR/AcrR family transcriptional regulator [Thermomicrobiales bacterium]
MASTSKPEHLGARAAPARPQSLKERQRQERERLILQAAMELLIEKGYHETAMEEIAARVGISKGALYLHFPGKEDLIAALFVRGAQAFMGALNETLSAPGSPREKLGALVEQIYGAMSARFQLMSAASRSPELLSLLAAKHDAMAALWEEPTRRVAAVIDEGKRRGEFDPQLPTPLVVALLWSLLSPRGYQQLTARDGMAPEEVVRHLRRYFLKAIAADAPPPAGGGAR